MKVSIDGISTMIKCLNSSAETLKNLTSNLKNHYDKIKEEGWDDSQADAYRKVLSKIAANAQNSARAMKSTSDKLENLKQKVQDYNSIQFNNR